MSELGKRRASDYETRWRDLLPWVALVLQIIGGVYAYGELNQRQQDEGKSIEEIRQDVREIRGTLLKR